jgi:hypothetical protein
MSSIIVNFIKMQQQVRIFHWQSTSYSRHNAFGSIYSDFDGLIDEFMEVYMGKYGRVALEQGESVDLYNIGDLPLNDYLQTVTQFLLDFDSSLNAHQDTDLLNLRDEMLSKVNKLKYLLTLK